MTDTAEAANETVAGDELDDLLAVEASLVELGRRRHELAARKIRVEEELGNLGQRIRKLQQAIRLAGGTPIEWGGRAHRNLPGRGPAPEQAIDHHLRQLFLRDHADDRRGTLLELDDLAAANGVAPQSVDCVIAERLFEHVHDVGQALEVCHGLLKPGGVLLAVLPCAFGSGWRFTPASAAMALAELFAPEMTTVRAHGNLLVTAAFVAGEPAQTLLDTELATTDPRFPLLVTVRAVKAGAGAAR